jgi:hypothetical protein
MAPAFQNRADDEREERQKTGTDRDPKETVKLF